MRDKAKGPDNNKRLAQLESGVATIAIALTANGFTVGEGADPLAEAVKAIKSLLTDRSSLNEQLHNLAGFASGTLGRLAPDLELAPQTDEQPFAYLERLTAAAEPRIAELLTAGTVEGDGDGNATVGELAAIARADAAEAKITDLLAELGKAAAENEQLNIDLEQLEARNEDAAEALDPPAPARDRPENARDFGPTFGQLDRAELAELVSEDAAFEISFSNGEYEIVALAPVAVKGSDLMATEGRYSVPVIFVRGGDDREDLHGAVLVHGGEQIGYCEFPRPIELEPKQERRFERAITFG